MSYMLHEIDVYDGLTGERISIGSQHGENEVILGGDGSLAFNPSSPARMIAANDR